MVQLELGWWPYIWLNLDAYVVKGLKCYLMFVIEICLRLEAKSFSLVIVNI